MVEQGIGKNLYYCKKKDDYVGLQDCANCIELECKTQNRALKEEFN